MFRNFLASVTGNGLSLAGTGLALASIVLIISLFVMELLGFEGGPYLGILTYLILPVLFVFGLILIPIGSVLHRRKLRRTTGGEGTAQLPVFDLNVAKTPSLVTCLARRNDGQHRHTRRRHLQRRRGDGIRRVLWLSLSFCDGARAYKPIRGLRTRASVVRTVILVQEPTGS